ncbi:ABC transporter permease [Pleionea sp. CnH1-48]|uniref:ABC transporter permease n=1 Tax=Pleionea sp. CnH1-48 TaxID=2954494 RepID=UPI0020985BF1|nr:ABC transporter permease [Pleionea sp. CnH1-48]MCO7225835.1 ABC transporter permease [Pleionea sp. CnH1-48]
MSQSFTFNQRLRLFSLETQSEFLKVIRMPAFALPSLAFPLMFYVFFGLIFNRGGMSGQMPAYLMATYGVFGIIGPALFSFGVNIAVEKDHGWLALKQASPMPISAYFVSKILTAMMFALIITMALFSLAAIFGDVRLSRSEWAMTLLVLLLGVLPFCTLGLWLGLQLKAQAAPAVVNLLYLPMAFLSGLWIPIDYFPDFLQKAANLLPAFHLAQLTLKVQSLDIGQSWMIHLAALAAMTAIFLALATRAFHRISNN